MENVKQEIIENLKIILKELGIEGVTPQVSFPQNEEHGDYTTNIAMTIFGKVSKEGKVSKVSKGEKIVGADLVSARWKSPMELAQAVASRIQRLASSNLEKVEVVAPGFVNFWLSKDHLISQLKEVLEQKEKIAVKIKSSKRIMVEYAHPNTHKEMHIGHMRTLITGESIARLNDAVGNKVFRANYQGDIGPHVAKAIHGVKKLMEEENLTLEQIETRTNFEKAYFLGRAYVKGNQDYEQAKAEIDGINTALYERVSGVSKVSEVSKGEENVCTLASEASLREVNGAGGGMEGGEGTEETEGTEGKEGVEDDELWELYRKTRQWSLDYYDEFYTRFYTKFDRLFFESEVAECGKKIVEENVGKVFEKDGGAIVFNPDKLDNKEEKHGLHTRVFITKQGYPTYEGKDMCLGYKEYAAFPFDKNIHVVGSEQAGYFKVIIKALELIDPEKFKDTQYHLSMGMVNIVGMKISSRTGEILRVDTLIDKVKEKASKLITEGRIKGENLEKTLEEVVIGAIKYSVLKVGTGQNVEFDIEKSVALDGNSGPYLQYTYARTQSVLNKFKVQSAKFKVAVKNSKLGTDSGQARMTSFWGALATPESLEPEELSLLRTLYRFPEVIAESANNMAPNVLANYLFDLAKKFNLFYQRHSILGGLEGEEGKEGLEGTRKFRLGLTEGVGIVLKNGLDLLGIKAPERM